MKDAQAAIESGRGHRAEGAGAGDADEAEAGVQSSGAVFEGQRRALAGRSGKLARLTEMLEETLEAGDRSLIFTQFTEMGAILQSYLQEHLRR